MCNLKSGKELKKVGTGAVELTRRKESGIHTVRWLDNSTVQLSFSHEQYGAHVYASPLGEETTHRSRLCASSMPSNIVREYNEHTVGVDLAIHMTC